MIQPPILLARTTPPLKKVGLSCPHANFVRGGRARCFCQTGEFASKKSHNTGIHIPISLFFMGQTGLFFLVACSGSGNVIPLFCLDSSGKLGVNVACSSRKKVMRDPSLWGAKSQTRGGGIVSYSKTGMPSATVLPIGNGRHFHWVIWFLWDLNARLIWTRWRPIIQDQASPLCLGNFHTAAISLDQSFFWYLSSKFFPICLIPLGSEI